MDDHECGYMYHKIDPNMNLISMVLLFSWDKSTLVHDGSMALAFMEQTLHYMYHMNVNRKWVLACLSAMFTWNCNLVLKHTAFMTWATTMGWTICTKLIEFIYFTSSSCQLYESCMMNCILLDLCRVSIGWQWVLGFDLWLGLKVIFLISSFLEVCNENK